MPSEKSRYLKKRMGPPSSLDFSDLKSELLSVLGSERLVAMLWIRSQWDNILRKALVTSIAINLANGCFEKAKAAIDYALYFPDYIRYDEHGHGFIIDEIKNTIEKLFNQGDTKFAVQVAHYTFEQGNSIIDNFEDDWEWITSLNDLENWIKEVETMLTYD